MDSYSEDRDRLKVRVVEYFSLGDGSQFNDHFYNIDVHVEGQHRQLDRCILDFVEMDRKLRKRYPRCRIAALPLAESTLQILCVELEKQERQRRSAQNAATAAASPMGGAGGGAQRGSTYTAEYVEQPLALDKSRGESSGGLASLFGGADGLFSSWGIGGRRSSRNSSSSDGRGWQATSKDSRSTAAAAKGGSGRSDSIPFAHEHPAHKEKADMSKIVPLLNTYLSSLLFTHELLVSEELCLFVDQEASAMTVQVSKIEPLSIHDILLLNEPQYQCIVRRREEVTVRIMNNQILLWRFATQEYDIAFSVELNGETKISYTRYNSHLAPVCGVLLVDDVVGSGRGSSSSGSITAGLESPLTSPPGKTAGAQGKGSSPRTLHSGSANNMCSLVFDNTYAKLHTKKLSWSARVVSIEDYQAAKEQAMEVQKERRKFELQRHAFRRQAIRIAARRSGVIHHTSSVVTDYMEEETVEQEELQHSCNRLQAEAIELNKAKQVAEAAAIDAAEDMRAAVAEAERRKSEAAAASAACHAEKDRCVLLEEQLNLLQVQLRDLAAAAQAKEDASSTLNRELQQKFALAELQRSELEVATSTALQQADSTIDLLDKQLKNAKQKLTEHGISCDL
jgi:hypothetical protein